jgi:hypothetical protein
MDNRNAIRVPIEAGNQELQRLAGWTSPNRHMQSMVMDGSRWDERYVLCDS